MDGKMSSHSGCIGKSDIVNLVAWWAKFDRIATVKFFANAKATAQSQIIDLKPGVYLGGYLNLCFMVYLGLK